MQIVEFNYPYSKLRGQKSGMLVYAGIYHMGKCFSKESYEYDTDGKYPLEKGKDYIQLVFLGDKEIPFTTYRDDTKKNRDKYFGHLYEVFEFNVKESS